MLPAGDTSDLAQDIYQLRFEGCFRDHYTDVLAFAMRRVVGREAAEDAVAETFAVVWGKRDRIPEAALPWLYAIAIRVIANQRRSSQRRSKLDERLSHERRPEAQDSDPGDAVGRRTAFSTAFGRLSEAEREVLRLVAWDGLDPKEAASVLGCTTGAYRVRLHRARRKLAKQLEAAGHLPRESRPAASPNPAEETR